MPDIIIIGTSHIAKESVEKVKKTIDERKPDVVAVELDIKRYHGLMQNAKSRFSFYNMRRIGAGGYLFALIGAWASKKLGRLVGVDPGEEMKTAIFHARLKKARIALIDQDIEITLSRFSRLLSWKERWNIFADIVRGLVFRKKEMQKLGLAEMDLSKVPSDVLIKKIMKIMKDRYPTIYRVLVEERNRYMANRLQELSMRNPDSKIMVVVGAGHVEGIRDLLTSPTYSYNVMYEGQDFSTNVYNLEDIQYHHSDENHESKPTDKQ